MNKGLVLKSLAAAVSMYAMAGFFGVPYILKNIAPEKVSEATNGGRFSVEKASFNPFTFHLTLKKVSFKTPQNGDFIAFSQFSINVNPLGYVRKGSLIIKDITLIEPKITLKRDANGDFNFKWLSELGGNEPKEKKPSEPVGLILTHFAVKNGTIHYSDYAEGKAYTLDIGPVGFNLDNIDLRHLSNANGKMRLYATINDGGFVDLNGKIVSLSPLIIGGSAEFDSGKLYTPWRYFKDKFPVEVADGTAGFGFDYRFNSNDINATELSNLHFDIDKLRIIPKGENRNLFALSSLRLKQGYVQPMRKVFHAESLNVNGMNLALHRFNNGKIDWMNYVESIQKAFPKEENETKEASPETPWVYGIKEIVLSNGSIGFIDEVPNKKAALALSSLNVSLNGFQNDPSVVNHYKVSSLINQNGLIALEGDFVRSAMSSKGKMDIQGVDISMIDPYIEPNTYASLRRGNLSFNADYDYTPSSTLVKGKVALDDWVVNDSRDDSVLVGWDKIGATPFVYAYPDNRLKINQLSIDGFYTNALIDSKKVLNYSTLSKNPKGDANTTKKSGGNPFGLEIVKLLLHNSSANFSDLSLPLPFKSYIHDMEGSVLGISTTKNVTTFVKLRGGVDQYGLAKINGQLNTKDPKKFTDMKVAFDNLELKNYTPYSLQFLGYKIEGGKLFLNLGYKIDGGKLNASNQVVIKQIELGAEKEGGSPWPMRFVVALLEDSDGVIDIDLPIEGDVNKPDFKYGKVVWQVIGNLFTKAVTSPFRLLGSLMGIESDKLSSIDFDAGSAVLLPPEVEKLDQITTMLTKRPKLSLNVYGGYDEVGDIYALKGRKLVQEALKRNKKLKIDSPQAMSIDLLEDIAEDSLDKKELKALKVSLEEKYPEEAAFVRYYSAALIDKLIPLQPLAPQELQALAQQRSETIRKYLTTKTSGFEKRVMIRQNESAKAVSEGVTPVRLEIVIP